MGWLMRPLRCYFLGFLLLATPQPGCSWYKHSASPRYHTVGRASGLLIGVRRSPYLWRRELENFQVSHQGPEEDTGAMTGPWRGAGTELHLYPDPGEMKRSLMEKLQSGMMEQKARTHNEIKRTIQDGESREDSGWMYKGPGGESSLEDSSWMSKYPGDEGRSPGESMLVVREPEEEKRTLEESWLATEPQVASILEEGQPGVEARSSERYLRMSQVPGQERRPGGEDLLSMLLKMHLQEGGRSHPWRTQTTPNKQDLNSKSKSTEGMSCEDLRWTSYKVLCRASLQLLSHSPPQPQKAEA